jgi:putative phosphoesterase
MPSPLTHISGVIHAILTPALLGTSAVLMERWDAGTGLELIERERVTYMVGAPTFLQDLVEHRDRGRRDTSSLRLFSCGGAAVSADLIERARALLGCVAKRVYGSTEFPTITTTDAAGRVVGIIADTHGLVRPEALAALAGTEAILHAGDVGDPAVLDALAAIAPVTAVRGNNDRGPWAERLHATAAIEIGGVWIYVVHDLHELDLDPRAAGFGAVVAGHSHRPSVTERDGVLYLNPGSAGPRRFRLPIAVARLRIDDGRIAGEVIELAV